MRYYREADGDYLQVDEKACTSSGNFDARGTAIAGLISSVQGTSVTAEYLKGCKRVAPSKVPQKWMRMFQ